jgi:hypothetical protein
MKYKYLASVMVLFMTLNGRSQSDFRQGYLILNSGDTLYGYIEYRGNKSNARKCVFKKDLEKTDLKTEYSPEEITAYRFIDSKYYISQKVTVNGVEKMLFLEYLIHGKIDIFYYRDESGEHYLADKGNTRLIPLTNDEKNIDIREEFYETHYLVESKKYIGVLKYLFQESPEISQATDRVSLNHESLIKITRDYHNAVCKDEACIIYEKKEPKVFVFLGPLAGANIYFLNRINNAFSFDNYYFIDSKWKASINPSLGLSLSFNLPSWNERMFLEYDITLNREFTKTKTSYFESTDGVTYNNDISLTQYSINNSLFFKYEILPGSFQPEVLFGGFVSIVVKTDYSRKLIARMSQGLTVLDAEFSESPFKKIIYGIVIGTGCTIKVHKEQKMFIDLKYYSGLGIFPFLNTNIISLNVGLPFIL